MFRALLFAGPLAAFALTAGTAQASEGHDTAKAMTRQYHDTRERCGAHSPAFVCSGIFLRSTRPSTAYHSWEHSPNSKAKGGVAFSYLRADAPIRHLAEDARSGYTLAPISNRPANTLQYSVLCAFPTDGDSWTRDKGGCGDNQQTPKEETFCHEQGIRSAEDWIANYQRTPGDPAKRYFSQCAFDMHTSRNQAATREFTETLKAMRLLGGQPFPWNEMLIKAWDETQGGGVPIQSFFYIKGLPGGLDQARYDQKDYHATVGRFVPIIEISLPRDAKQNATFIYRSSDQNVSEPQ